MHARARFFNLLVMMTAISTVAAKPQKYPFPFDVDLRCEIGGRVILSGYTFYDNCNICRFIFMTALL